MTSNSALNDYVFIYDLRTTSSVSDHLIILSSSCIITVLVLSNSNGNSIVIVYLLISNLPILKK